eukprot:TRINITY_DN16545_c0_g2_i1.p1 TRINITY_DN16545_c0_g2~~TRINITY_DN16545_c0_g2_i1.p1  ORF type:complete len:299 (+),score=57.19 TRINITY_DN16545_c0_g2_i1:156-1052(+)
MPMPGGHGGGSMSSAPASSKVVGAGVAWNQGTAMIQNGQGQSTQQAANIRAVEEATMPTPKAMESIRSVLDFPSCSQLEAERVMTRLVEWLAPPQSPEVVNMAVNGGIPQLMARTMKRWRSEPPTVALACMVCARASGCPEGATAHIRAGALEEVTLLMDRHVNHGGIQNVCLRTLAVLLKDAQGPRQAVSLGLVSRVLRAMDTTNGREVQYNGLSALRLLAENGRAPRAGVQDAAMRAKVSHQGDDGLLDVANDVLCLVTPRFKEVICWHWQSGWCKLGPKCTYAHGPADLFGDSAK